METTRILLVRHGQSQGNAERRFGGHSPSPLSELGRRQAEAAGRALASEGVTAAHQVVSLIPGDSVRTLPSARPTSIPPP